MHKIWHVKRIWSSKLLHFYLLNVSCRPKFDTVEWYYVIRSSHVARCSVCKPCSRIAIPFNDADGDARIHCTHLWPPNSPECQWVEFSLGSDPEEFTKLYYTTQLTWNRLETCKGNVTSFRAPALANRLFRDTSSIQPVLFFSPTAYRRKCKLLHTCRIVSQIK